MQIIISKNAEIRKFILQKNAEIRKSFSLNMRKIAKCLHFCLFFEH